MPIDGVLRSDPAYAPDVDSPSKTPLALLVGAFILLLFIFLVFLTVICLCCGGKDEKSEAATQMMFVRFKS